ncbi:MAG: sortase [Nocardioides sp.]
MTDLKDLASRRPSCGDANPKGNRTAMFTPPSDGASLVVSNLDQVKGNPMSVAALHLGRRAVALILFLTAAPLGVVALAPPTAADVPITTGCGPNTTTVGTTITLTADCTTTQALTVPDGFTLDGAGFTIHAINPPAPAHTYTGAVVTNAAGAASMHIENLTVTGPATGFPFSLPAPSCNTPFPGLFGIFFNDAGGSVNNVEVLNIFQTDTGPGSPACNTGHSIRAVGVTAPRTVTITDTEVSGYQKAGMFASGSMTMNVSMSTIGPPSPVPFSIGQNGVQWTNTDTMGSGVGASGTMTGSTIVGSSFGSTRPANPAANASTAVLLFGANNVTVDDNTITGGSDIGINVTGSTNTTISFNRINRPSPPTPDNFGIGVNVGQSSQDTTNLICNTFDGWNQDIDGAIQIACPPLPPGAECEAYSAQAPTVEGDATPPFIWSVGSGSLPPGLALASNGDITGTSPDNSAGTYEFTLQVETANDMTATSPQEIMIAPGCSAAPSTPRIRTQSSDDRVIPGQPLYDRIRVRRLAGGRGATAVARLYGPFTSLEAATCGPRFRVRTHSLHVTNGWNRTPTVRVNAPGVYTWKVTLRANAANRSATHRCGQAAETTLVAKAGYVSPIVAGGFSGTIPPSGRQAPARVRIAMPAIGMHAPVRPETLVDGRMTPPRNVGEVGWLRRSAGFGDKIGKAVVGGHVSDRHDSPGAMFRLNQARAGQPIIVTKAGKVYRFEVVSKATFDRRHKLPHRYFTTTGPHRLVLISCTARVVSPNGHFHYTRYVVVVAKQIRSH